MSDFVSAIIVAAGGSTRMGTAGSKQFITLLNKPVIAYTLAAFQECSLINEIIVVCREEDRERIASVAEEYGISKLKTTVTGGSTRPRSVSNGVKAVSVEAKYLAIHDGARPLITAEEIAAVVEKAFETDAATLGTPVTDTVKVVDENHQITGTPDRSTLRAVQTPQVFFRELYEFALEKAGDKLDTFTDDCSVVENMGVVVEVVDGSSENIKLTTPVDVIIAESIAGRRAAKK